MKFSEFKEKIIELKGEKEWEHFKNTNAYDAYTGTKKEQKEILNTDGTYIMYINNPSEELQLIALSRSHYSLLYMHNLSERVMKEAVKGDNFDKACALKYIENDLNEDE